MRRRSLLASLPCRLLAMAGLAGVLPVAAESPTALPPILVEGTVRGDLSSTPGAARELDEEALRQLRPYTLHDALLAIPGLRTLDDDVLGRRAGIGIRGAPSRRSRKVLLLEDGVPINASPYLDGSGHYTPPTQRLERVEVLKGTGHVIHGPLNNHGIINFRSKGPTLTPTTHVELAGGNQGSFLRHVMHQRTDGNLGTVVSFTGMDGDGAFDVERTRFDDYHAGFEYAIGEGHRLGLSGTYFRERSNYDESNLTPVEYALDPRRKRGRFGQEFNSIAVDYSKLDLYHQWQAAAWTVASRVFVSELDRPRFTVDPDEIEADALPDFVYVDEAYRFVPGESGVMVSRSRRYRMLGTESRVEHVGPTQTWSFGVQVSRNLLDDARSFGDVGEVLGPNRRGSYQGRNELAAARLDQYQATATAVYVQDAVRLGDWTLTPGLRAERYTVQKVERFRGDTPIGSQEDDTNSLLLPSIAALWQGDNLQVFANLARGYTPAFARTAEEFPLRPETGINSQVGLRKVMANGLRLDGAVFYNWIEDTVVQLPFTIDDNNVRINAEDSRSYGLDLGLNYATTIHAASGLQAVAEGVYSYARAEFSEGSIKGNAVPQVPEHVGALTLGLRSGRQWHASVTLQHHGAFFSDLLNTRGLVLADEDREPIEAGAELGIREVVVLGRVPSHTLLSARAGVRLPWAGPDTELWISGRNLTDRLYINDLENGIRPGAPRTFMAGLTARF